MAQYIVQIDMQIGDQYDDNGITTPVTIKKGQIVEGDYTIKTFQGVTTKGIMYHVATKRTKVDVPQDGLEYFFIPNSVLTQQDLPGDQPSDSIFTLKNIIIGISGIIVIIGIIFVFSKLRKS